MLQGGTKVFMITKRKNSVFDLYKIYSLLAFYTESKIPVAQGINICKEELKIKGLQEVVDKINKGESITVAFKEGGLCDSFIEANLEIGSKTGIFVKTFKTIEHYLEGKVERRKELEKLIIYPMIILILLCIFIYFLLFFAIPQIFAVYKTMEVIPPKTLEHLFRISSLISNNLYLIIFIIIVGIFTFLAMINVPKLKQRIIPLLMKVAFVKNTFFSKAVRDIAWQLSLLLDNGLDIIKALKIIKEASSSEFEKNEIEILMDKINLGKSLSESCEPLENYLSKGVLAYLKAGEDTGNLSENIYYIYKLEERKQIDLNDKITRLIQPVTVIVLGLVVASFIGLLLPLLDSSVLYGGL